MTTTTITKEDAERAIRETVTANPDRTNMEACIYVVNQAPHCVAAVALASLGVPIRALDRLDVGTNDAPVSIDADDARAILAEEGFTLVGDALDVLGRMQRLADFRSEGGCGPNRFTWAEAWDEFQEGSDIDGMEAW